MIYPEILVMLVILIGFLIFLAYQGFLALWVHIHKGYSWWSGLRLYRIELMPNLKQSPYYAKSVPRNYKWEAYYSTIDDPVLKEVAIYLEQYTKRMSDTKKANFILKFVQQNIKYVKDKEQYGKDEFWQLPINTLARKAGDCEDSAFLCASLMKLCGLDVINVDMVGHITCAVNVPAFGKKYSFEGKKYYRAETTSAFIQYVGINVSSDTKIERLVKPDVPTPEFKDRLV